MKHHDGKKSTTRQHSSLGKQLMSQIPKCSTGAIEKEGLELSEKSGIHRCSGRYFPPKWAVRKEGQNYLKEKDTL